MIYGLYFFPGDAMMNMFQVVSEPILSRTDKERAPLKNTILKLRENSRYMNNSDRKIVEYILLHTEKVTHMNIRELSRETFSSASTIYRMCRSLGFQGYKDFKQSLIYDVALRSAAYPPENGKSLQANNLETIMEAVTRRNILSLQDTQSLLDLRSLQRCVSLLTNARTLLLFGAGESFCVAKDAYLRFLQIHKPCILSEDLHTQLLSAKNACPEDLGIVISHSGQTPGILACMTEMRKNETPIIAVTPSRASPAARLADCTLYTAAGEPLFEAAAPSSRIAQMNVMDILYTAYVCQQEAAQPKTS